MAESRIPECAPRWFFATDLAKADATPFKPAVVAATGTPTSKKSPALWKAFSDRDSTAIEAAYQKKTMEEGTATEVETKVPAGEDQLFEADIEKMEFYPVYWLGPIYEIKRGTWFMQYSGSSFMPCDDNLVKQLEDGFRRFQPWKVHSSGKETVDIPVSGTNTQPPIPMSPQKRWALFGPFMNQYVIYTNSNQAWLQNDNMTGKLARAVNMAGVRLIRGWDEVIKFQSGLDKAAAAAKEKRLSSVSRTEDRDGGLDMDTPAVSNLPQVDLDEPEEEQARQIDHLVFVIHGIGQKLGERIDSVNFAGDCSILRSTIKEASKVIFGQQDMNKSEPILSVPDLGGVQVLPVMWRQKVKFGMKSAVGDLAVDDNSTLLEDITLDTVPSIRMLVSDVVLDVLLYMTPRYRQEMISHVTEEMNRIYRLYKKRHPNFKGKVSVYGHSLGSLLAFDILSNQDGLRHETHEGMKQSHSEVDLSELLGSNSGPVRMNGLIQRRGTIKFKKLEFEVQSLFAVGSPIGLFLVLKGDKLVVDRKKLDKKEENVKSPAVETFYNIFHPHDPVAYRIEPLIDKRYKNLKPAQISYTKGGLTGTIDNIQTLVSGIFSSTTDLSSNIVGTMTGLSSWFKKNDKIAAQSAAEAQSQQSSSQMEMKDIPKSGTASLGVAGSADSSPNRKASKQEDPFHPDRRIDYIIQEGIMENAYLSALGVHMNYWQDQDCAAFILRELYGLSDSIRKSEHSKRSSLTHRKSLDELKLKIPS